MYIVLEAYWEDSINVITDENGYTLLFDSHQEAEEAALELQRGIVVKI